MDIPAVLAAHDRQVRRSLVVPAGVVAEDLGRVVRTTAMGTERSFVEWSGLDATNADAEITAQVAYFGGLGLSFEWKTYGRDQPADLGGRLTAAGFVAEDPEAFVVGELADVLAATEGHASVDGVEIREAVEADLPGLLALSSAVWEADDTGMYADLFSQRAADPQTLRILVAVAGREVAGREVVCSGWLRRPREAEFASLWGGATLAAWRGRGIYRALVRRRALLARDTGHRYLQVDCTPASRPILERLGMQTIDTTTPYRWRP